MPFDNYKPDDYKALADQMNRASHQSKVVNELVRLTLDGLRKDSPDKGNHSHVQHG
jgi:hypothetical protein